MADIKNIVSFGCSWTYGDELLDPELEEKGYESFYTQNDSYRLDHCYTGIIANQNNLTQENLAFPGSSLQSMQWNLMWWLNNHTEEYIKQSIILVGLTDESRVSWYDPNHDRGRDDPEWNNYLHAQWLAGAGPNVDDGWFELRKYYVAMSDCKELHKLNYDTTTTMFDGIGARYNIPVVQFNVLANTECNLPTFYNFNIREIVGNNYCKGGHPTELGHSNIATEITKILNHSMILT